MIAKISGLEQDIVDLKTALQTAINPVHAYQIWWTLVHSIKKDKLLYKKRIREERMAETVCYSNDLHKALLRKSGPGIDSFREGLEPPMLGVCNLSLKA